MYTVNQSVANIFSFLRACYFVSWQPVGGDRDVLDSVARGAAAARYTLFFFPSCISIIDVLRLLARSAMLRTTRLGNC